MNDAKRIAQEALARAKSKYRVIEQPSKDELAERLAAAYAECSVEPVLCAAQLVPERKPYRRRKNLKDEAFDQVLADGAALLAEKAIE